MTVREARENLQHPKFGDERCIRAVALLRLADEVRSARKSHEPFDGLESTYASKPLDDMTEQDLIDEQVIWGERGYNGQEFDEWAWMKKSPDYEDEERKEPHV